MVCFRFNGLDGTIRLIAETGRHRTNTIGSTVL